MSLAVSGLAARAGAQNPKAPPPTELNADMGFVNVSGNTSMTSFNANERYIRRIAPWEFKQEFGSVYGKTNGAESSNLWRALLRADYDLAAHWALYGLMAYDRDKFAGITSRFGEGAGAVAKLIATSVNELNLEAGVQFTQQKDVDGVSDNFTSLRAATSWKHVFLPNAYFLQTIEALPNLQQSKDLRVNTETDIVAPVSSHVGLKFSYVVRFDNLPALNAAGIPLQKTDRILSSGIQITY